MATLVLTAVGSAVGGPLGAAVGAIIGSQVDKAVLGAVLPSGKLDRPGLKELSVQTSSYGTQIPAVFGKMRVAGSVIWASDLIQATNTTGGGKSSPSTTTNSYSVHLAVALSSRPVADIGKIWADGNVLRGAAGDFKVQTGFRVHHGYQDQMPDPLIASAELPGQCPAFRGIAYVVFENLQLAEFGNRIPSLTFEVIERIGPVSATDISIIASDGLIDGNATATVIGYSASGRSAKAALLPLVDFLPASIRQAGKNLRIVENETSVIQREFAIITEIDGRRVEAPMRQRPVGQNQNTIMGLRYFEPTRDYQPSVQISRIGGGNVTTDFVDFAATVDAGRAVIIADHIQMERNYGMDSLSFVTVDSNDQISTGTILTCYSAGGTWLVSEVENLGDAKKILAKAHFGTVISPSISNDPGRPVFAPDTVAGPTTLVAIELPNLDQAAAILPIIAIAAAGENAGWKPAALSLNTSSGILDIGTSAAAAIIGSANNALPVHSNNYLDTSNELDVTLLADSMSLPLQPAQGLFWLNGEIAAYGQAEQIGTRRYMLRKLQRGMFGTSKSLSGHAVGDRFILLQKDKLRIITDAGQFVRPISEYSAEGLGDTFPVYANLKIDDLALMPRPPVHGKITILANGDRQLSWVRVPRVDFGWRPGVDQPLVESQEQYRIRLFAADLTELAVWTTGEPVLNVPAFELASYASQLNGLGRYNIQQVGDHANSDALLVAAS
jgi:hypothetical protein